MVTTTGWVYLIGGTILFFFWAYGLVSFLQDLKNYVIPGVRGLVARRREAAAEEARERERTETERQLY